MEPQARMTSAAPHVGEPADSTAAAAGSSASEVLDRALAIARTWAGERAEALVLSGSHASGEGVWCEWQGRRVTLSDLDVYAILPDEHAVGAARARARAAREGLSARLLEIGLAAPLELGLLTRGGLSRQPAKPGTIELARRGRVIAGDRDVLAVMPRWTPGDVSREELLLLLENRGFELLLAHPGVVSGDALRRLRARHALLKASADLATVMALAHGELPEGTRGRIEWARAHAFELLVASLPLEQQRGAQGLGGLWDAALAWRSGRVEALAPAAGAAEWTAAARAWVSVWWAMHADAPREPWARVLHVASRAPMRRRARQALLSVARQGATAPLGSRLKRALSGTPQHRVNGSAAVLLLAAAASSASPALPVGALRALRALGVTGASDWAPARQDVVRAWDLWLQDGQRTAEDA